MKNKQLVDLSGYMFSGKSAVSDLLREFEGIYVPSYQEEFELIRVNDGLLDLYNTLSSSWSPNRADNALRSFERVSSKLACTPKGIEKLWSVGFGYSERYFKFDLKTKKFIDKLKASSWKMNWPTEFLYMSKDEVFRHKLNARVNEGCYWPEIDFSLTIRNGIEQCISDYLYEIFSDFYSQGNHTVVMHNALEPYSPEQGIGFIKNGKCIIIDRDVRDIYVNCIKHNDGYNDNVEVFKKISGASKIESFIERQRIMRITIGEKNDDKVLRIRFEDLVYNYEITLQKIIEFLNLEPASHNRKLDFFNPKKSINNCNSWLELPSNELTNIKKIEQSLPEYCYGG
ncbi:sulfotransferase domain-containing protein [Aeromonas hydrophila]|uniref:sulfotransferase domain-containing protein n=2 Tax=Aeromonas hydrophila TaxID=644 RepID=UPI00249DC84A|nr:sulfotransferase domain-containing protein [Aeromonas hydrophila]WGY33610.1 sulfotransferase domain-containing protein [Aeromonas hydrophila]